MEISFYGAAKSVTGSKHLLTLENGKRILLDCGMFQGGGDHVHNLNRDFGFDPESVDYLILSHAHTDHTGLIPRLVRLGYRGKIYCTPPTQELCQLLLIDGASIQRTNAKNNNGSQEEPLYTKEDAEQSLERFVSVPYNKPYTIDDDIVLLFTDAGHMLGSSVVNLTIKEEDETTRLCFTGDVGRYENRILRAPQEFPQADVIICESTYGSKFHSPLEKTEERLRAIVQDTCVEKGGKLLIPAFSIGRTQELIYSLNILAEDGRLPEGINVFVDSPLSVYATDITRSYSEYFNNEMLEFIKTDPDPFGFERLHFITEQEDSKILNAMDAPCVIISSSGMMEAGRIRHHLRKNISDPRNTILVTGYCEPSTLGGRLLDSAKKVTIFDEEFEVKADVIQMNEYSAHADFADLVKFLHCQDKEQLQKLFLVHGEESVMKKFKSDLEDMGYDGIEIPDFRMSYKVKLAE
jgi:metallo-beta-lactamase family protein